MEIAKIPKLPDFTVLPDLDVDFLKNRQNRQKLYENANIYKNCLKSAKSSHAVPTEHTYTGLPAISVYDERIFLTFLNGNRI